MISSRKRFMKVLIEEVRQRRLTTKKNLLLLSRASRNSIKGKLKSLLPRIGRRKI